MQMKKKERARKLRAEGVRRLLGVARHNYGRQRWLKAVAAVFLPSLLSPLFLFSAPPSSIFFRYLLFFSFVSSRSSVAVWWCAVAVERKHGGSCCCSSSLVFFSFFFCHFPFFPASLMAPFSPLSPPESSPLL